MSDENKEDIDIRSLRDKLISDGLYQWPVLPEVPAILQDRSSSYKILSTD